MDNNNTKEEMAIDALIAASLRASEVKKIVSEEEALNYFNKIPDLSSEDKSAVDSIGSGLFDRVFQEARGLVESELCSVETYEKELHMAMNRKNAEDDISEETKLEIEKKREEIRKKYKAKRKKGDDGNADTITN